MPALFFMKEGHSQTGAYLSRFYYNTKIDSQCVTEKDYILNPWWVTGFCDAESSFSVSIQKSNSTVIGWTIAPCFIITLHKKDLELLKAIHKFFNYSGHINVGVNRVDYKVRPRKDLAIVIEHFKQYTLHTSKMVNFVYFCKIF